MHRSYSFYVLFGSTIIVSAAHADVNTLSPDRPSPAGEKQQPDQRSRYQTDARYHTVNPDDTRPFARQIAIAARESGLDPELVHAVIAVESAYQPAAVSPRGALGLMQVLPSTANLYGVRDASKVSANLRAGTRHLSGLMARFDNRLDLVLAAYNAGEGAVRRYGNNVPPFAETRNYVPAVMGRYQATSDRSTNSAKQTPGYNYRSRIHLELPAPSRPR